MARLRSAARCVLLALLVSACAAVERAPPPATYRLELDQAAVPRLSGSDAILRIARPEAAAGVNTRGIAYRAEPHQLRYYTKSRWADTPARMLATVLTMAFEASGPFRAVVDDNTVPADYLLTSQLLRLEQHLPPDGEGTVQIWLRLQLVDLPERRLLGSRLVRARAPASSRDAAGAVAAAHAALAEAVTDVVRFVGRAIEAAPMSDERRACAAPSSYCAGPGRAGSAEPLGCGSPARVPGSPASVSAAASCRMGCPAADVSPAGSC